MSTVHLEIQQNRYLLSIDKAAIDRAYLDRLIKLIRVEYLATQANFGEDIETLGERIKDDWWNRNKTRLLNEE